MLLLPPAASCRGNSVDAVIFVWYMFACGLVGGFGMLRWLFLDMNSYFASVEQQLCPELRGKPVAVAPVDTDHTSCIAASYEAKAFGVKTGTNIGMARHMCPGLRVVSARPAEYIKVHHRILEIVETILHVDRVESIDEMACRLPSNLNDEATARQIA